MFEKIRFWNKTNGVSASQNTGAQNTVNTSNSCPVDGKSFKTVLEENQTVEKYGIPQPEEPVKKPIGQMPSYYCPNIKVVKYGIPPRDEEIIVRPMYAVPSPEIIEKDEYQPPLLKYAMPPIEPPSIEPSAQTQTETYEPPALKYAIPEENK